MPISIKTMTNLRNAGLFVLGVLATIVITKIVDKASPNDPIIVKEYADTIKIIHEYQIPKSLDNDSTRIELEKKIRNLELLNNYDNQIKERIRSIEVSTNISPNLILTQSVDDEKYKGFIQESSSSYFTSDCPSINTKFIDLKIEFVNSNIIKDIAYLRVNIYKYTTVDTKESLAYVLNEYYEVKPRGNFIRISNDLSKGKFDILYGFVFKMDLTEQFPRFFMKKCVVTVN